ncbi:hypothetical protein [Limnofasciculus baicalensis]|uniref:Uncharacterized protein n=1 Tax=Limnofasciculus baicalensis BBK-W-15 TaxID=2699891 RepID=A0AAE3KLU9_9CYAN|nr:hypothetical protein [Limnofasciculus baicalensis]MCP2728041.1 hypothetical protein [Limnofasciculus baicalensis BBK-W-15]
MTNDSDSAIAYAVILLRHYGFELRGYTPEELVNIWLNNYQAHWIRLAVIESLYRGRYKAVSVEQILTIWLRRGQPFHRFNGEFERLISRKLPKNLTSKFYGTTTEFNLEAMLLSGMESYEDTTATCSVSTDMGLSQMVKIPDDRGIFEVSIEEELEFRIESENSPPEIIEIEDTRETSLELDTLPPETVTNSHDRLYPKIHWSPREGQKTPINQFTPPPDSSDFYQKLKKVAQKQDEN